MDSYLDALRLGEDLPRGGGVMSALTGVICAQTGREPAWREVDHLDARAARRAARRLEAINARRFPWADTLTGEKWETLAMMRPWFAQKTIFQIGFEAGPTLRPGDPGPLQTVRTQTRIWLKGKRGILADYVSYTDRTIAEARLPFALRLPDPPLPTDPAAALLVSPKGAFRLHTVRRDIGNALLLATLALRAYRVERGVYPVRLDELATGGYLLRLPDDPCAPPGTPLRYQRLPGGKKYLLYSVGVDGKDDRGRPVNNPLRGGNGRKKRVIKEDDKGDLVAGVNTF
jgi:hypothetical protein